MSGQTRPFYELTGIRVRRGGREVLAVESLSVAHGAILGITGPNGSGKSTLLNLLALLETSDEGTLTLDGAPARPERESQRRRVTLMHQDPYLLKRSVAANVGFGLRLRGEGEVKEKVRQGLLAVGLAPEKFARRSWRELSGGEARRVALASRLVLNTEALLLDEPTAGLDAESATCVREAALAANRERGVTLVIVSHDVDWLASVATSRLGVREGRLEQA